MPRFAAMDMTGMRFGRLVALEMVPKTEARIGGGRKGVVYWKVKCDCGQVIFVEGPNLRKGNTKSCGCLRSEAMSKRMSEKWAAARRAAETLTEA